VSGGGDLEGNLSKPAGLAFFSKYLIYSSWGIVI
jgi:hypothetical protein